MLQCQYYLFKHLHFPKSKFIKKKKVSLREFRIVKDLTCVLSLWVTFIEDQQGWRICKIILAWSLYQNICDSSLISLNVNKKQYHLHTCYKIQTNYVGEQQGAAILQHMYFVIAAYWWNHPLKSAEGI